jgi:hypothetical protein
MSIVPDEAGGNDIGNREPRRSASQHCAITGANFCPRRANHNPASRHAFGLQEIVSGYGAFPMGQEAV